MDECGSTGREQLLQLVDDRSHDLLQTTAGGQLQEPMTVEAGAVGTPRRVDAAGADPRGATAPLREGRAVQSGQRTAEGFLVGGRRRHLVDRRGHQEVVLHEHDLGYRRGAGHGAQPPKPVSLVGQPGPTLTTSRRPDASTIQVFAPSRRPGPAAPRARDRRVCQDINVLPAGGIARGERRPVGP